MSCRTRPVQHGLGLGRCLQDLGKPGYCPELQLNDDRPSTPSPAVFNSSSKVWPVYDKPIEQNDWIRQIAGERARPREGESSRTSQEELTRLSAREYSLRVSDPNDFASIWESTVIPVLTDLLRRYCGKSDFAVDVHNFPEMSSDAVPRVIYITLAEYVDPVLEQNIRNELEQVVPARFNPLYLKFRKGTLRRSGSWWGMENGDPDEVCEPRNIDYRETPVIGMSIGPVKVPDAASLGGFIQVGSFTYAMSAAHAFEDSIDKGHLRVTHPAGLDLPDDQPRQYDIGSVNMLTKPGVFRPSITFRNMDLAPENTMVEMDWCLIGPVANGKNFVSVPSFERNRYVAVETTADVEGNTEVYAMARTSGYSLGFTSDVPGLQQISGIRRREWTIRQYSPFKHPKDSRANAPWQTVKQWVTSGIGVPGDSGAWVIRRRDNALLGLVWGRNYNRGGPLEHVRLTYFTPIVDILADVEENHSRGEKIAVPTYSAEELRRVAEGPYNVVQFDDVSRGPWNPLARGSIQQYREGEITMLRSRFVDGAILPSSVSPYHRAPQTASVANQLESSQQPDPGHIDSSVLAAERQTTPPRSERGGSVSTLRSQERLLLGLELESMPELSNNTSSVRSSAGSVVECSELISMGNVVHILEEENASEDITTVEGPIRAKAYFRSKSPALIKKQLVSGETRGFACAFTG